MQKDDDTPQQRERKMETDTEKRTIFTGWAHKQASKGTNWSRRFFVLKEDRALSFFTDFQVLAPKLLGTIDLGSPGVRVLSASEIDVQDKLGWPRTRPRWPRQLLPGTSFAIDTQTRTYFFRCDSAELAKHFVAVLKEVRDLGDADVRKYIPIPPPLPVSLVGQTVHQMHFQSEGIINDLFHDVGDFVEGWVETYTGRRNVLHDIRASNLTEIQGMLHDAFEVYEIKNEDIVPDEGRVRLFFTLMKDFFQELAKILYGLFKKRKDLFFVLARVIKFFGLVFSPGGLVLIALKDIFEFTFRGSQTKGEFQHMVTEFQQSHYMDAGKWCGRLCKRFTTVF